MGTPKSPVLQEAFHDGGFLVSTANGHRFIDQLTLSGAAKVLPGTVLGRITLTNKFVPLALSGTDGSQTVAGISYAYHDVTSADAPAAVVVRDCEVNATELIWPTGASGAQITAGQAALAALGILVRA